MNAVPQVEVAERAGAGAYGEHRPSEGVVSVLPNAVVLLDGATSPRPGPRGGGWYASLLAGELVGRLTGYPGMDLADLLAAAIRAVAREHGLASGESPSSTVALVRWDDEAVEGLVLADSPVVAVTGAGVHVLTGGCRAEADPDAAYEASRATWPRAAVLRVLLASGGVSRAIGGDPILPDWATVADVVARRGAGAVLD
ncbi:hypothetical protein, partial [Actinophytocola sp.]|uniref:hypothetical protein n=1 Tax=Actinophytocola sp. TaxID=1872138 RepID=UPI003D6BBD13